MSNPQWQLSRCRILLEAAFASTEDMLKVSKTIDNYSRYQARLYNLYRQAEARLEEMQSLSKSEENRVAKEARNPSEEKHMQITNDPTGFVLQKKKAADSAERTGPNPEAPKVPAAPYGTGEQAAAIARFQQERLEPRQNCVRP